MTNTLASRCSASAALVHRHRPVEPHHLFDGRRQPGEALRAGIGVIRHHHRAQLVIAHGVGAAVGQHVEEDIAGGQQEGVVAGVSDRGQAVTDGGKGGLLDNAHFVHLHRDHAAIGQANAHLFLQFNESGYGWIRTLPVGTTGSSEATGSIASRHATDRRAPTIVGQRGKFKSRAILTRFRLSSKSRLRAKSATLTSWANGLTMGFHP